MCVPMQFFERGLNLSNLICIPVAACGIVNPSIAAAAMTLSSNGILLHSLRLNKAEASDENRTL